jgi:hypothetical protein
VNHSEIRARLSDYLERDLSPDERSRVEAHLASCPPCGSELRELRATVSLLQRLPDVEHPAGLADAVMARVARDASRPSRVITLVRRAAEPRFAASLAAGIAGLMLVVQAGDPGLTTQPSPTRDAQFAAYGSHTAAGLPPAFTTGLWGPDEPRARAAQPAGAGLVSGATPFRVRSEYARRAYLQEVARLLRGAGHPHSASFASHFEARPTVVMADWQPR